ncbi:MAG: hypothetical protein Q9225_006755, partial [Loekoesia sp. 1 TL-2023]
RVLGAMKEARDSVEGRLKMAEEKGWKLLVVCIGAELEALVEGEEVLRGVLGVENGGEREATADEDVVNGDNRGQGMEDVRELNALRPEPMDRMTEETDDDEPGPELLMSTPEDELGQLRI